MSKTIRYEDWHIKVVPNLHGLPAQLTDDPARMQQLMNDLKADIESRITSDVSGVGVSFTRREMCSHCDLPWEVLTQTEHDADPALWAGIRVGEPLCCDAAAKEWRATQTTDAN